MRLDSIRQVLVTFFLPFFACNQPTGSDYGEFPTQPSWPTQPTWLDVKIDFEKLPTFKESAELIFDITVTGEDTTLPLTFRGDTLNHLVLRFFHSDWIVGSNGDADTIWQNKIELAQSISLSPLFQMDSSLIPPPMSMYWINDSTLIPFDPDTMHITHAYPANGDTTRHFWSRISLGAAFHDKEIPKTHYDSLGYYIVLGYTLLFDYRTGDNSFIPR